MSVISNASHMWIDKNRPYVSVSFDEESFGTVCSDVLGDVFSRIRIVFVLISTARSFVPFSRSVSAALTVNSPLIAGV